MRATTTLSLAALCSATLVGCPLDDRTLTGFEVTVKGGSSTADSGEGGEGGDDGGSAGGTAGLGGTAGEGGRGGSTAAGGSSGTGQGGKGGSAGTGGTGAPAGRCPDLDFNGVLDCEETLAENATFDSSSEGWAAETGMIAVWEDVDSLEVESSGSLGVENQAEQDRNGLSMVGARQCVPVTGGAVYQFAVEVHVPEDSPGGQGGLHLIFYDGAGCTGTILDSLTGNLIQPSGWKVSELNYQTHATAKSVVLRLISLKNFQDPPLRVLYDNMLMREY